jgi:NitT/TauT family transport system substrate-binding protein
VRDVLMIGVVLTVLSAPASAAQDAIPAPVLRIALEAGGTFTWVLRVVHTLGLDRRHGVTLEPTPFATKAAAEAALRAGDADVKVDDWLFVSWARARGLRVRAVDGFSNSVGGVVVRSDGPIRTIADLRHRRLGVTSIADKGYLALRAVAAAQGGFDLQSASDVFPAAPLLLTQLLERGDVDAIVQYWQFIPRLVSTGRFRELASTAALVRRLAPGADLPFLVIVATDDVIRSRPDLVRAFLASVREGAAALGARRDLWDALFDDGVLGVPDRALIPGLMARYRTGMAGRWDQATIDGLGALTARLVKVAGPDIVGVSRMDPAAYSTQLVRPP